MDKSIIKRIKALESKTPKDLVICYITEDGEEKEARVKELLTRDGELKEEYKNINLKFEGGFVRKGSSLKDLDRILRMIGGAD